MAKNSNAQPFENFADLLAAVKGVAGSVDENGIPIALPDAAIAALGKFVYEADTVRQSIQASPLSVPGSVYPAIVYLNGQTGDYRITQSTVISGSKSEIEGFFFGESLTYDFRCLRKFTFQGKSYENFDVIIPAKILWVLLTESFGDDSFVIPAGSIVGVLFRDKWSGATGGALSSLEDLNAQLWGLHPDPQICRLKALIRISVVKVSKSDVDNNPINYFQFAVKGDLLSPASFNVSPSLAALWTKFAYSVESKLFPSLEAWAIETGKMLPIDPGSWAAISTSARSFHGLASPVLSAGFDTPQFRQIEGELSSEVAKSDDEVIQLGESAKADLS